MKRDKWLSVLEREDGGGNQVREVEDGDAQGREGVRGGERMVEEEEEERKVKGGEGR